VILSAFSFFLGPKDTFKDDPEVTDMARQVHRCQVLEFDFAVELLEIVKNHRPRYQTRSG
jgi:hypothetical protein